MFLFSAKNSAGDFCCRASALRFDISFLLKSQIKRGHQAVGPACLTRLHAVQHKVKDQETKLVVQLRSELICFTQASFVCRGSAALTQFRDAMLACPKQVFACSGELYASVMLRLGQNRVQNLDA